MYKKYVKATCFTLIICLIVAMFFAIFRKIDVSAVSFSVSPDNTVVIDAGHGGFDGGTVSLYGDLEKDINLSISQKTSSILSILGYNVIMLRSSDNALDKDKKSDMYKRLEIIKSYPDSVFISIHQNHFTQPKYSGAQMFYGSKKEDESKKLAEILQYNFINDIDNENTRKIKPADKSLFLFKNAPQTCVLIECGFLSNPKEAKLLMREDYRQKVAFVIAKSVCEYFDNIKNEGNLKNGTTEV